MKANLTSSHFEVFFKKEMKVIKLALNSYAEDKKPEHLHSLRVSIKKIRAVSCIVIFREPSFKKTIKPLKSLFQEAGIIRGMQINTHLLTEFQLHRSKPYIRLVKNISESSSFFCRRINLHLQSLKHAEKKLSNIGTAIKSKHLQSFLKEEEIKLKEVVRKKNQDEEHLHEIRKQLKKLLYVYKFLPDEQKTNFNLNFQKATDLQEKIGNWHDRELSLNTIQNDFPNRNVLLQKLQKQTKTEYRNCIELLKKEIWI
jgi:CHAD domain-containing protein